MGATKWHDRAAAREVDALMEKELDKIGIRGTAISTRLISGHLDPALHAVETGMLRASLTWVKSTAKNTVAIGVFKSSAIGKVLHYAVYVFLGTNKMAARPVLRTMLEMLKKELKDKK